MIPEGGHGLRDSQNNIHNVIKAEIFHEIKFDLKGQINS